ncbi:hypothetical protein GQ53DRAFT_750986 [Thozetella sp. PMI_491]|nr:hypothetical protein GQ53DRAFT_750986 [Thozetella sp. PMI_491]
MLPVTRAISQWKWNIYQSTPHGEPLAHFQILDSASRGVWGSLGLLKSLDAR